MQIFNVCRTLLPLRLTWMLFICICLDHNIETRVLYKYKSTQIIYSLFNLSNAMSYGNIHFQFLQLCSSYQFQMHICLVNVWVLVLYSKNLSQMQTFVKEKEWEQVPKSCIRVATRKFSRNMKHEFWIKRKPINLQGTTLSW